MRSEIQEAKLAFRRRVRERLAAMTADQRAAASTQARALLRSQSQWKNAVSVLFYAPVQWELDVWPLVAEALSTGKTIALPRFAAETNSYFACRIQNPTQDLKSGKYGIREPADHCAKDPLLKRLDLILVPGVAFDLRGRRLGRGKGFYDRLLAALSGTTCGVAFDQQIVKELPVAPHDAHVNCILTPTRWIEL